MQHDNIGDILQAAVNGETPATDKALLLADAPLDQALLDAACQIRDQGFGNILTYSRKVFIPLTQLCRDVCHYCTFAKTPRHLASPYMDVEEVLKIAREGKAMGCKEALLTLGEKPELRYSAAREALEKLGFATTLEYVASIAGRILEETGLLPHINAGNMNAEEIRALREVSASMGIMLESASARLCEKGMPHYGSPDKHPAARIETLRLAGQAQVPFSSGILIGIGETRPERIESLLALRDIHREYGHIQEIIVQNFCPKPGTKMANQPATEESELLWTLAVARVIFGSGMSIQVPPNLNAGKLRQLIDAGINDWGGVSPLTPDHVNPEAPWPHIDALAKETAKSGKHLSERLTVYPAYARSPETWLSPSLHKAVLNHRDTEGLAREDAWLAGRQTPVPKTLSQRILRSPVKNMTVNSDVKSVIGRALNGSRLNEQDIVKLFQARGDDFEYVCQAANEQRQQLVGDTVTYVVNRNINYTNICYFKCRFCAFSKGKTHEALRGKPYDLAHEEIVSRAIEAWERGATEVCLQGGIHPDYSGDKYLEVLRDIKSALPDMHVHAFSPLEIWQGAETLGVPLKTFLQSLKDEGLGSLPGTAAEILDDEVRDIICPDKINTAQWLEVMRTAHSVGLRTTATIMFGHVDGYQHWARHLLHIRHLQEETGGFTEFVPLPFVAEESPMYLRGLSRRGPSFRESVLMHAVARLTFGGLIKNIQTSWVKMGPEGASICLSAGVNDLGGTLMDESITRAAGAKHGQEFGPRQMEQLIKGAGRSPRQRTTLYQRVSEERTSQFSDRATEPPRKQFIDVITV